MKVTGNCLCSKVKVSFETEHKHFDSCHCSMCRTWGGAPAMTVDAKSDIVFEGEEFIKEYQSSEWAKRGFCSNCGTNLYYKLINHDFINFNLGLIDNSEEFEFKKEIYIDSKPGNYSFSNDTTKLTEEEILAQFQGND